MPEITYARSEDMSKPEIRRWAAMDTETTYRFSLLALAKIEACRQWVADNPEYPDGTIAYVVTNGGTRLTARMGNGCWIALNPHTAYGDSNLSDVMRVDRILHTPPTIRDHLHAIGLDDEAIRQVNGGYTASISRNVIRACEEAGGL